LVFGWFAVEQNLLDRIYECAFAPEFWPIALHELALVAEARGGLLFAANAEVGVLRWMASQNLQQELARYVSDGWLDRDRRRDRVIGLSHAGFLTDYDVYTDAEIAADPVYSEFLFPAGLGWAAGTAISPGTGDALFLTVERNRERGPVEPAVIQRLDELRPHLARSAMMSVRLNMERASVASETLALIGLPALVFNRSGKIVASNQLVEKLDDYLQWRAGDHVVLKDPRAQAQFQQAVATIGEADAAPVRSFALRPGEVQPSVAHVIPICGVAQDIFVRCAGVLVMTPVNLPPAPTIELIQSLFDLTPAEARIARALATGQTVGEIASAGSVSLSTVRSQVRGVLEKTACHRQAEMIALLSGLVIRQS
jgi:DNA-binding CsgD family transcriptional regulator